MFRLLLETATDHHEVEYLLDLAFGPGRTALSSYRLRENVKPVHRLCLVARDDYDVLAGAIRFWPVRLGDLDVLLLGPIAVHPTRQGEGLGNLLIQAGLERAREAGWPLVVLVGDLPYYVRLGFEPATPHDITFPAPTNPDRVLVQELLPGTLAKVAGEVRRAEPC